MARLGRFQAEPGIFAIVEHLLSQKDIMWRHRSWLGLLFFVVMCALPAKMAIETPTGSSVPTQGQRKAGWHQQNQQNGRLDRQGGQQALRPNRHLNRGQQDFAQQNARIDQTQGQQLNEQQVGQEFQSFSGSNRDIKEGVGGPVKELFPGDRVPMYTRKMHHKAAVAMVAFMSATILSMVLVKLLLSKTIMFLSLVFATGCLFSCYTRGDFGQFSKALGVATILFLKKLRPRQFFVVAFRQFLAAVMFSARKPFPPVENPWRCKDVLDASEVAFSMVNCLLAVLFMGMILGFNLGNLIPFFPSWVGGLLCSIVLSYMSTTRSPKGDLLRYVGHSANVLVSDVFTCAEDVYLKEKSSIFLNHTFSFVNHLDKRFGVLGKVQALCNALLDLLKRTRRDIVDSNS